MQKKNMLMSLTSKQLNSLFGIPNGPKAKMIQEANQKFTKAQILEKLKIIGGDVQQMSPKYFLSYYQDQNNSLKFKQLFENFKFINNPLIQINGENKTWNKFTFNKENVVAFSTPFANL